MIIALLAKELQQHGPMVGFALALAAACTVLPWAIALQEEWVTLLATVHLAVRWGAPPLAVFLAGRLVVHDHRAGTHEFVAALPISPLVSTLVRFAVGLCVLLVVTTVALLATALLASRREGVPPVFVLQLSAQLLAYSATWFAVAFAVAHLGRNRWLAWWLLVLSTEWVPLWFGLVEQSTDLARLAPPWDAVPTAAAWFAGSIAVTLALSTWRGGILVARAFRPATAFDNARLFGMGIGAMVLAGVLAPLSTEVDPWDPLPATPAARSTIRAAGSEGSALQRLSSEATAELDGLAEALEIAAWPPVVLLRTQASPGRPAVALAPTDHARTLVLLVDLEQPHDTVLTAIITECVAHRLAGLQDWDPAARWLVDGLAPWWLRRAWTERAAAGHGKVDAAITDWHAVRRALGDRAPAVAWAGVQAVEDVGGRRAVLRLAQHLLTPETSTNWPSAAAIRRRTRPGWVPRVAEIDGDRWRSAWALRTSGSAPAKLTWPPLDLRDIDGEKVAQWRGSLRPEMVIEWVQLDALQSDPLPRDRRLYAVPTADGEVSIPIDVRTRVAARWVVSGAPRRVGPWTVQP